MKLLLAGGGTAGHVNPLLALASELHKRFPHSQLRVLGTAEGLETELVPAAGWPLDLIPRARLPRQLSRDWLAFPGSLAGAVHGAKRVIKQLQADAVVGFGGYVAAAAYLAAWRNCPIIVHEANHHVGWANRLGFHLASGVATSFAA
ncbi:MAG: glycosyltransferase, partial [Bifidobacteriaceae bacterium]|nr:glycosyltransferase [Bifidobacteriaceae bacterium]